MKGLNTFNKFVLLVNVFMAFLLFLACIAPFVTWAMFSFLSFLSLIVPYLVLGNAVFLLFWLFKGKRQFLISFSMLVLGYITHGTFIKIRDSNDEVGVDDISLLTFNVNGFSGYKRPRDRLTGKKIGDFIQAQDADIVCLQEYGRRINDRKFKNYPYVYRMPYTSDKSIQVIMSKYPIISKGSLELPDTLNEIIYADILIENDTLRVYNNHLQSLSFRPGMLKREEPQRLFKRLDISFQKQREQVDLVLEHSKKVNFRKIICGDFNNTQFSYVYRTLKGEMNDSFLEKGNGLGSTYKIKFIPFRIDYILADPDIEIKSHKNFNVGLSDHEPVMASFRLKE